MSDKLNKEITDILKRLEQLEKAVFFGSVKTTSHKVIKNKDFSGPKGGVLLLISEKFFSQKRTVAEVKDELEKQGYIGYKRQVIQNTLNRLSAKKGDLISQTESGVKVYAKRK